MNPRFKGLGFLLLLVPVLSYIPLRAFIGDYEETHRSAAVSVSLAVSGALILAIAAFQDKKSGIEVWSANAWTSGLLESQHICFHIPLRLAGAILLFASGTVFFAL
jgi:hypothetical protein